MYLFVAIPNNSGSTLVAHLLATSPNVSIFKYEGHDVARDFMPHPGKLPHQPTRVFTEDLNYFINPENYNWPRIKEVWHGQWNKRKSVLASKTPNNVIKVPLLAENMSASKFILGLRNPYAFCSSMLKYRIEPKRAISHWKICASYQQLNLQQYPERCLFFKYADLCDNTKFVVEQIIQFEPLIGSLNYQHLNIKNMNEYTLDTQQTKIVDEELAKGEGPFLMEYFGFNNLTQRLMK